MTELEQRVNEILYREMEPLRPTHADDWSKLITAEILSLFGYPLAEGEKLAVVKEGELPEVPVEIRENWPLHKRYYKMAQEEMLKAMSGKFFEVVRII